MKKINIDKDFLSKELTRTEMSSVIGLFDNLFSKKDFKSMEEILDLLDKNSSVESMICLLRSTFFCKEEISNYESVVNECKKILIDRGSNYKDYLRGLPNV